MATIFKPKKHIHHSLAQRLRDLSMNMWWTWNPEAQALFNELSPLLWRYSNHSAVEVMSDISDEELESRLRDHEFSRRVHHVIEEFDSYMAEPSTWAKSHASALKNPIAYFSAEFGIHESLPIYSGGLGILSGDHTKSASDLGLHFIGIGLFYRRGYFQQHINADGWQEELYPANNPDHLPMELVLQPEGGRLLNSVEIGHSTVYFQTWAVHVGRVMLYLLDTNLPENDQHFQELTATVYGGNIDTRIGQEIVLGIGGARLLQALGITPAVYHMNEGHSAFLVLELLKNELETGKSLEEAERAVRSKCVFTTHTPVQAGHDRFNSELLTYALGRFWNSFGLSHEELMSYGRVHPAEKNELFTMTVLAIKMSRAANGVSELHGHVSREMWKELFQDKPVEQVPIGYITNGIHTPGWATAHAHDFWNKRLGIDWTDKLMEPKFWKKIADNELATDEELWALRYSLRRDLVDYARRQKFIQLGGTSLASSHILSPDALTIGFARRFATYKRAPLVFRHLEKIIPLFTDPKRPLQIIFAGKAHPHDHEGKRFIQRIIEISHRSELNGKVIFLENYDINVARHLISGADVWLNTPRRPFEASGTSGMKITIHGGVNLSIMDGWWREGYNGNNGWSIGDDHHVNDLESQDELDFESLVQILSGSVIPEFYDRDDRGIPHAWIKRIRNAMQTLLSQFSSDRMLGEYVQKYYSI
ncbi:MAG: alpha-glucan family phosphorylase [Ignavibacteriae bacterium]|nr:MAG: alpha-glucan family phosphorylase [Ignavibacteriota bacterium]